MDLLFPKIQMSGLLYWSGYRRDNNKKFKLQTAERSESKETIIRKTVVLKNRQCVTERTKRYLMF